MSFFDRYRKPGEAAPQGQDTPVVVRFGEAPLNGLPVARIDFSKGTAAFRGNESITVRPSQLGLEETASVTSVVDELVSERELLERQWRSRMDTAVAEARREAAEQARAEHRAEVARLKASQEQQLQENLQQLHAFENEVSQRVLHVAALLARKYAEHILERDLREEETNLVAAAIVPIKHAVGLDNIQVVVHPEAVPVLEAHLPELRAAYREGSTIRIEPDHNLRYGDVRVVADGGQIESIMAHRLDRLVDLTRNRLETEAVKAENLARDNAPLY